MRRSWLALLALPFAAAAPLRADFVRGDASFDGRVNVLDAIIELQALFRGGSLPCLDAADSNDDGRLGADDVILILILREGVLKGPPCPRQNSLKLRQRPFPRGDFTRLSLRPPHRAKTRKPDRRRRL